MKPIIPAPTTIPVKNFFKVAFSNFKPMSAKVFLSIFKNKKVIRSAALIPIIPYPSLSNLAGMKGLTNEKNTKSPVNNRQNRIDFKMYFIFKLNRVASLL